MVEASDTDTRAKIEALKPYNGGHKLLWPLHQLDIMRKHKRQIDVDVGPETFNITMPGNIENYITPIGRGWVRTGNQETALAFIKKGAPKPHIRFTPRVLLDESALEGKPLMSALNEFARLAHSIIGCFDVP